jgi:hypothetical protein
MLHGAFDDGRLPAKGTCVDQYRCPTAGRREAALSDVETPEVVSFIENSARLRAAHYREEAARFRALADREPLAQMRRHLRRLADEYDRLAADAAIIP